MLKIAIGSARLNRYLAVAAVLICVYTLAGILGLPFAVKMVMTGPLAEKLKRRVAVHKVEINPYNLSMRIFGLSVLDPDGERFVAADEIHVNGQFSSLFKGGAVIRRLKIKSPYVRIVRTGTNTFNFSDIGGGEGSDSGHPAVIPGFRLRDMEIIGGTIRIEDRVADQRHEMAGIRFSLPFISSFPVDAKADAQPRFSATINGAALDLSGVLRPFAADRRALIGIDIKDLDVRHYLPYISAVPQTLVDSGIIALRLTVSYGEKAGRPIYLSASGPVDFSRWRILDPSGRPVLEIPRASVELSPSNLLARQLKIARVACASPAIEVIRSETGSLNLLSLMPPAEASPAPKEDPAGASPPQALTLNVEAVRVEAARISFTDRTVDEHFQTILEPVDVSMDRFTLQGEHPADLAVSLRTEKGEIVEIDSRVTIQPLSAEGILKWNGILPAKYSPYYRDRIRFDVTDGTIGGQAAFRVQMPEGTSGPDLQLSETAVTIQSLKLTENGETDPFAAIPELSVQGASLDMNGQQIRIGSLASKDGALACRRFPDGTLNFQKLVPGHREATHPGEGETEKTPAKPWQVTADTIRFEDYRFAFEDLATEEPVRIALDRIVVTAEPLTMNHGEKSRFTARMRWNERGNIAVTGDATVTPVAATVAVEASDVDIRSLQPYFTDKLRVTVIDGGFFAKGELDLTAGTNGTPNLRWRGETQVNRFAAVDKKAAEDFIRWGSLFMDGMDIGLTPLKVHIGRVALSDYYSGLVVHSDGTVNITTVFDWGASGAPKDAATQSEKTDTALPDIRVGNVTVQNGSLRFTDLLTQPNFRTEIHELGGRISGLSSQADSRAEVVLSGIQENTAPLEIKGQIQPFTEERFADLKLSFKNIGLSPFSTYSGRYIGYLIEKGKLHMDLAYELKGSKLDAKNLIVLDQLTLGDRVESPDATSLPVAFAISLLKDRSGKIEIDLPVAGDVKDPEFKIGKIVLRVIVNLITKIVTSPFAALGSLFGGGEELSYVVFPPGGTEMTDPGKKKLDALGKALYERPSLQLEIRGEVDPVEDLEQLGRQRFDLLVKAEKRKASAAAGGAVAALESLEILPEEYPQYLKAAYDASDIPKPRDPSGKIRELTPEEMEKLMRANVRIGADDLRLLAHERASRIRDYLVGEDREPPIDPERIFILEPEADFGPGSEGNKNSRVTFTLK